MSDKQKPYEDYEIDNPAIKKLLQGVANTIGQQMPDGWGFTLFMFDYAKDKNPGSMFYISSAQRDDMLNALGEFMKRQGN